MRRAIEKLTFSLLSLAVASLFTFVMLTRITDGLTLRPATLPLLFNAAPRNVRDLSLAAAERVARGGSEAGAGQRELERLGGATFPHVLPHLDALSPRARGRVAVALGPVALRMGIAQADDVDGPERAIGYFTRFWQDRSADFRGAAVKRKVQRLAERALPLRQKEVTELDTFALPELLAAIGAVHTQDDVRRVARLVPVITHLTGLRLELPPEANVERARTVVTELRSFANENAADFATLDGPARVSATVTQTRYFRWLAATARSLGPDDPSGRTVMMRVLREAASSLPLGVLALVVALGLVFGGERLLHRTGRAGGALGGTAVALAGIPASVLALAGAATGRAVATLGLSLALAAMLGVELRARRGTDFGPAQVLGRGGALLPIAVAAELAVEAVAGRGLGAVARRALALGDLTTLMWAALPVAVLGMLGVALADWERPRTRRLATELEGTRRHPRTLFVLSGWFGLLVLFALAGPALVGPAALPTRNTIATAFTLALSVPWILGLEAAARALHAVPLPSLVAVPAEGAAGTIGTAALLFVGALGASLLFFAFDLTPREVAVETPSSNVVLALKRRVGSASSPRILDGSDGSLDERDGAR